MKKKVFQASLAAVLIQPAVFISGTTLSSHGLSLFGMVVFSIEILLIATVFFTVVWLPIFWTLSRLHVTKWHTIALVGFIATAMPIAIIHWPTNLARPVGHVVQKGQLEAGIHDETDLTAWRRYAIQVSRFGAQGLAGALAFSFVWLRNSRNASPALGPVNKAQNLPSW